ncbi:uncharacterized protein LOC131661910 isoform X1 [Vicia villosa]|uniref:uncharacterized protein LOC131661910 isoform X1 n=1 Tax=Vicia villosa TaxID=3911 RepID=UPI00273B41B9|nr:uncharacterized protein LOC131661910 isoform X1 [Vicia villosa]
MSQGGDNGSSKSLPLTPYEEALEALSSLITKRTRVGDVNMEERFTVLFQYLKMLELEEAISNMKIIHVAGTKGKTIEKMVENKLRWFGHVKRRHVDYVIRRVDRIEINQSTRRIGRSRKAIREVIKKDLEINDLDRSMVLDRTL